MRHLPAAAVSLSLLLHSGLLWLVLQQRNQPSARVKRQPQGVTLQFVEAVPPPTVAKKESPPLPSPHRLRKRPQPVQRQHHQLSTEKAPQRMAHDSAVAKPNLFDPAAIQRAAEQRDLLETPESAKQDSNADTHALAQKRLDEWTEDYGDMQRARSTAVTPALRELGEAMAVHMDVPINAMANAGRFGIGAKSLLTSYLNGVRNVGSLGPQERSAAEKSAAINDPNKQAGNVSMLCFGACFGMQHGVAMLAAIVEITHGAKGEPIAWKIAENSADNSHDKAFDASALEAVKDALSHIKDNFGEHPPTWTQWLFKAEAYRWGRFELMTDPTFKAPGREVPGSNGITGKTTIVHDVTLLRVRFGA